jgi:hypothetical protein
LAVVIIDVWYFNVFSLVKYVDAKEWLKKPEAAEILIDNYDLTNYRLYSLGTINLDYKWARDVEMQKGLKNTLFRNFNMLYGIPNNQEWAALFIEHQTGMNQERTILDEQNQAILFPDYVRKGMALQAVRYLTSDVPIIDENLKEISRFPLPGLMERYFFTKDSLGRERVVKIPSDKIYLYETDYVYPRVGWVSDFEVVEEELEARKVVLGEGFDPTRTVVLENKAINESMNKGLNEYKGRVRIVRDGGNGIEIEVEAESDGFLVLHDIYYPGWKAEVNGEEAQVLRANYAFRAVRLPKGKSLVRMSYMPSNWQMAKRVSFVSLGVWVVLVILGIRKRIYE